MIKEQAEDWTTHLNKAEQALKALVDAATEGPWRKLNHSDKPERWIISGGMAAPMGKLIAVNPRHQGNDLSPRQHQANAAFIAAAREAVPALLLTIAVLRALVEEIAQVRDWVREQRQKTDDIKEDSLFHGVWEEVGERLDAALALKESDMLEHLEEK